jgi:pimeloyl-ACP methyl ester carboxylesterase
MRLRFDDRTFDYQTLRAASYATYGGAALGEVVATADRIPDGDFEAWHLAWRRTADRVRDSAETAAVAGRDRTAGRAFHRAHTYYRTAEFFLPADDARRPPTYDRSRATFVAGLDRLGVDYDQFEVPYGDATLPATLYRPTGSDAGARGRNDSDAADGGTDDARADGPRPTVVLVGGFDATAEELYFLCGVPEALERGYVCVAFDGPGQGAPLRTAGLTARHDWERVVGPVLDRVVDRPAVDADRVGLLGASMGGYYAPRAAAFDDRVAAVVAFDQCFDLWDASAGGNELAAALFDRLPGVVVNATAELAARFSPGARWQKQNAEWVFGTDMAGLRAETKRYSLRGVAGRIDCPTLVLAGEDDHLIPVAQAYEFADSVGGDATLRVFTEEEGAADHCQLGNLSLAHGVVYDWLDDAL